MGKAEPRDREGMDSSFRRNEAGRCQKKLWNLGKVTCNKSPDQYCIIILIIQMREMVLSNCIYTAQ